VSRKRRERRALKLSQEAKETLRRLSPPSRWKAEVNIQFPAVPFPALPDFGTLTKSLHEVFAEQARQFNTDLKALMGDAQRVNVNLAFAALPRRAK